jgi:hypothetical protein
VTELNRWQLPEFRQRSELELWESSVRFYAVSPDKKASLRKSTIENSPMSGKSSRRNAGPATLSFAKSPYNPTTRFAMNGIGGILSLTITSGLTLVDCNLWYNIFPVTKSQLSVDEPFVTKPRQALKHSVMESEA